MKQRLIRWLLNWLTTDTTVSANIEIKIVGKKLVIRSKGRAYWLKTRVIAHGYEVVYKNTL